MTKRLERLGLILLALALLGVSAYWIIPAEVIKGAGGAFGLVFVQQPPAPQGEIVATSTLQYLTIGAGTTTVTVNTAGTEQLNVGVFVHASSTNSNVRWRIEFSNSTTTVAADQLWFPEAQALTSSATTTRLTQTSREYSWLFASTTSHRLATSTAMNGRFDQDTTSAFSFEISDIAANWTRIIFYNPTGASTANDARYDTQSEVTALGTINEATSTPFGIQVFVTSKQPL